MNKKRDLIIKKLNELSNIWPDDLMLFAVNGSLYLIEKTSNTVVTDITIPCDGGDPGTHIDDRGIEHIDLD